MSKVIDLVKKGSLNAGQELIWNRRVAKQIHLAIVNQDGSITTADGVKHKTPSGAAKHLNGNKPVDGWLAWKIKSTGDSLASLRDIELYFVELSTLSHLAVWARGHGVG